MSVCSPLERSKIVNSATCFNQTVTSNIQQIANNSLGFAFNQNNFKIC